jgi:hypothetical protein
MNTPRRCNSRPNNARLRLAPTHEQIYDWLACQEIVNWVAATLSVPSGVAIRLLDALCTQLRADMNHDFTVQPEGYPIRVGVNALTWTLWAASPTRPNAPDCELTLSKFLDRRRANG